MTKLRVYVDSCIFILASRGDDQEERVRDAIRAISDEDIEFVYSPIVELESLPKPSLIAKYSDQAAMLRMLFNRFTKVECNGSAQSIALSEACSVPGLTAFDALHIGAAVVAGVDYLLTAEAPTSTMHRSSLVTFQTIHRG